jgi:UDP-N-acetylglucosamine 2-epimerase
MPDAGHQTPGARLFIDGIFEVLGEHQGKIVFPVHPRTRKYLTDTGLLDKIKKYDNINVIDPVSYLDSLCLIKNACKVVTDSGGIQKEAYILGTPCITVREQTEWKETGDAGWNYVTGLSSDKLKDALINFDPQGKRPDLYGNGDAGKNILEVRD